jgi:hypothetical protein
MKLEELACFGYDIAAWFIMALSIYWTLQLAVDHPGLLALIAVLQELVAIAIAVKIYLFFRRRIMR